MPSKHLGTIFAFSRKKRKITMDEKKLNNEEEVLTDNEAALNDTDEMAEEQNADAEKTEETAARKAAVFSRDSMKTSVKPRGSVLPRIS